MDSRGAKELARLIEERQGAVPERPIAPIETADAAPLFRWAGVEPPPREPSADEQ